MKNMIMTFVIFSAVFVMAACQNASDESEMPQEKQQEQSEGDAIETSSEKQEEIETVLKDKDDTEIGVASLKELEDGVKLNVKVHHLQPGSYGIHIHEAGVCEPPTFESAEGHFNPDDRDHGFYQKDGPHKGDMENLQVDEEGKADQYYLNELVTLEKDQPNSLKTEEGTSIVIHEREDDYTSQPAGDAGDRIYCGVISSPE